MPEEHESNSAKKRRIIHWNPEAGREQVSRRWTWKRIVGWSVGGFFGLIIVAGIINRLPKLVGGDTITDMIAHHNSGAAEVGTDAKEEFVTQAKAEQSREMVAK